MITTEKTFLQFWSGYRRYLQEEKERSYTLQIEYLLLREMIHIKLNMYPPMRYGTPSLSYADKFNSILNFFLQKERVEEIREKMEKLIEVNRRLQ
jgi:hypothetical protein